MATAERFSASFVNRLSIPRKQISTGYYRSKLFVAPFTTNPLVAAASPLLSLLSRLCIAPSLPPLVGIRSNIEHELHAFHSRLDNKAASEHSSAIAHYLLCATIDELLGKNYLRIYKTAAEFKAFTPSSYDSIGPQGRFFDIVNYIKEKPHQYLDLLELAYYCLITGFEGEFHNRADGRQSLDNLIEELFLLIQQYRAHKPAYLFHEPKASALFSKNHHPVMAVGLIAIVALIASYFTSYLLLENRAEKVQFGHTILARLDD